MKAGLLQELGLAVRREAEFLKAFRKPPICLSVCMFLMEAFFQGDSSALFHECARGGEMASAREPAVGDRMVFRGKACRIIHC